MLQNPRKQHLTRKEDLQMQNHSCCRSCKTSVSDTTYHSVNDIGYNFLTFKEMFEQNISFPILEYEPQEFCHSCAQKLIEWHEYKDLCQRTQESLLSPMISIKSEPDVDLDESIPLMNVEEMKNEEPPEIKEEPDDFDRSMTAASIDVEIDDEKPQMSVYLEPPRMSVMKDEEVLPVIQSEMMNLESESDSDENDNQESRRMIIVEKINRKKPNEFTIAITFETYIRHYKSEQLSEKSFIGLISFTALFKKDLLNFRSQLWTEINEHLVREIIFTNAGQPLWLSKVRPTMKDMSQFIEFSYNYSSYSLDALKPTHLQFWNGKQVILYIHPYSMSIKTKDQWIQVTNKLFKFKKRPEKKLKTHHETEKNDDVLEIPGNESTVESLPTVEQEEGTAIQKLVRKIVLKKVKIIKPTVLSIQPDKNVRQRELVDIVEMEDFDMKKVKVEND